MTINSDSQKPRLLLAAPTHAGHVLPMVKIAAELVERGYDVTLLTTEEFKEPVTRAGARHIGTAPFSEAEWTEEREGLPAGPLRLAFDMKNYFIKPTTSRAKDVHAALEMMKEETPDQEIVVLAETFFMGTIPMYLGGPLPKGFTARPKIIGIHILCYTATSYDCPPVGMGLPPDASEEGRMKNKALHEEVRTGLFSECIKYLDDTLEELGAVQHTKGQTIWDVWSTSYDVTLQMCPKAVEYPRSDFHPKIKFCGAIPVNPKKKPFVPPAFWDEVTRGDKQVVLVTQGTLATDYGHLAIPTMQALASRNDVLVVVVLGKKGAKLPEHVVIPDNARVVDYLVYDAVLPYTSVMVCNGGYGALIHGVIHGVPMVMGGVTEDKPETSSRAEFAGIAINLKTGEPSIEQVRDAVSKILADAKYKEKIMEIKKENEEMKAMDTIEKTILETTA